MAKVVSGRLPDELADWMGSYAGRRGVKRSLILEAAVGHFRELCASGVPDLPEPREAGRPKKVESEVEAPVVRAAPERPAVSGQRSRLEELRAEAAGHAAAARKERERRYAERGW